VTGFVVGFAAGVFAVLFGVGGGLFMVPALGLLLRLRRARAVGTSLAVTLVTAATGAALYAVNTGVGIAWPPVILLAAATVAGALAGGMLGRAAETRRFHRAFGVLIVLVGLFTVYQAARPGAAAGAAAMPPDLPLALVAAVGLAAGAASGLMGVGGGLLMVPLLIFGLGFSQKLGQGISLAALVPVAFFGALGHYRRGNIAGRLALPLAVGAAVGAVTMGGWLNRIPDLLLRGMYGTLLVAVGVWMVGERRRDGEERGRGAHA
jgi:uncharacterized membrane protein YfcA